MALKITLSRRLVKTAALAVLTGFLFLAPAAASAAAASISIGPSSGAPGTLILVDGSGFFLGKVTVSLDGVQVATGQADAAGNFGQVTFTVPRVPAGASTVTATDTIGTSASKTLTVPPPTAAFTPDSAEVLPGTVIQFDGTSSSDPGNSITTYSWDFGDGSTATGARPTHAYTKAGPFTVSLSITDSSGNTVKVSHLVTVDPIQTLIETIAPTPTVIHSSAPTLTNSGRFDIGQRVFCPGSGPSCTSSIRVTRGLNSQLHRAITSSVVGTSTITTPANGSTELTLKLNRQEMKAFRAHKPLPLTIVVTARRGAEETITKLNVVLKKKR